jgi:class 3 adenylate cyclase/predicted ATPase
VNCPECGRENPEGARFCNACGSALASATPERRKLATLLFCDVTGSTRLGESADAETVRELMFRYFHQMRGSIERHGGTVEKFVGDAVMAVFGVPVAHEDDAVRACAAALEMQARIARLNKDFRFQFGAELAARIGIATGEVVAGDASSRETFATGDAVNVAARLEQAAPPGEILIGETTYLLSVGRVLAEPVEPVAARGKSEPVQAYRLVSVALEGPITAVGMPFVAREQELAMLLRAVAEATGERRSRVVTLVGEPGVGKSRLAEELERQIAPQLQVLHGRCLSYGEGITFWPVAEVVRQSAGILDEHSPGEASARITEVADDEVVAAAVAQAIGVSSGAATAEEITWALREYLAAVARARPLLLVFDDIQWGEPEFLDLVESVGARPLEVPMLVLCLARPELAVRRPDWIGEVQLRPLPEIAAGVLVAGLDEDARRSVLDRAGGNPLFLRELTAFVRETSAVEGLPTTLSALLTARLDRMDEEQRSALECASIEGEVFHRGGVIALSGDSDVPAVLRELTENQVIKPAQARFRDEAAFRFHHILVRDAAYAAVAKRLRAELHERFARWFEGTVGDHLAEYEEIVGYHLEQAVRYRAELGPTGADELTIGLARRASEHLAAAGRRAAERNDAHAAVVLLERALALAPDDERLPSLLVLLGGQRLAAGRLEEAAATYDNAERAARQINDRAAELEAKIDRAFLTMMMSTEPSTNALREAGQAAIAALGERDEDIVLAKAWHAIGQAENSELRVGRRQAAFEHALVHARRAEDRLLEAHVTRVMPGGLPLGPMPVDEAVARCSEILERPVNRAVEVGHAATLAVLEAMRGDFGEARQLISHASILAEELDDAFLLTVLGMCAVDAELLAGDLSAAEEQARATLARAERVGISGWVADISGTLAEILYRLDRVDEAAEYADRCRDSAAPDDITEQARWRRVRAKTAARAADAETAERLAREAIEFLEPTDALDLQAGARLDLAEVLGLDGRQEEAAAAANEAIRLYERKGNVAACAWARGLLAELTA